MDNTKMYALAAAGVLTILVMGTIAYVQLSFAIGPKQERGASLFAPGN
jgi:hypothetical protein